MSHTQMTFGMLNEIMLGLRIVLKRQQRYFEVIYGLVDGHNIRLCQGSLLREEEPPYQAKSLPWKS